jgi:peptidoglycan/LPS O-acetylase OafA/YrhL
MYSVSQGNSAKISHIPEFDALRGLAIFLVYLAHSTTIVPDRAKLGIFNELFSFGGTGVQLFYVVSAATLLRSHEERRVREKDSLVNFYTRRFFRIAPAFYAASVITVLVLGKHVGFPGEFFSHLFLIHGFWSQWGNSILDVEWSISCEVLFYAIAPILFFLSDSTIGKKYLIGFSIFSLGMSYLLIQHHVYMYHPLIHLFVFCASVFWFSFELKWLKRHSPFIVGALLLLLLVVFHRHYASVVSTRFVPLVWTFGFCLLVSAVLKKESLIRKFILHPWMIFLGKISYSFYSFHVAQMTANFPTFISFLRAHLLICVNLCLKGNDQKRDFHEKQSD